MAALLAEAVGADVGVAGQVLGRGEERGQRAHLLALGEHAVADGHERVLHDVLGAVLEVGRRVAGVRAGHADARARLVEAALELGHEEQVGELGLPVGAPARVAAALPVEVVEVDRAHAVRARGDDDHAVA